MSRTASPSVRGLVVARLAGQRERIWLFICLVAGASGCGRGSHEPNGEPNVVAAAAAVPTTASAAQIVAAMQAQTGSPVQPALAQSLKSVTGGLQPQFAATVVAAEKKPAAVVLPQIASEAMTLKDSASGASISVTLLGAQTVAAQTVGGFVVYPAALPSGAAVLHRALPGGSEDFLYFTARPPVAEVDYILALGAGAAGLRLIESGLEVVDATGTPRLRVAPPFIVGSNGTRVDGTLAVSDCAVDTDPSAPWGRSVTTPGATHCTVQVTWPDDTLPYPAILDPRWTTTGSMVTARWGHTSTLLSTGKVLVVAGTTNGNTALRSAELYDPISGTWAATSSMASGQQRWRHTATQLLTGSNKTTSGKVLIAGGFDGSFTISRCQLYSVSAGTWSAATSLDRFRQAFVATLLSDGKVLATGGMDDTGVLATASVYDPSFTTGGWSPSDDLPQGPTMNHQAALLTTSNSTLSNKVIIFGGNNGTTTISSVSLYDEVTDTFSTLASLPSAREGHTMTVLPNGNILATGGLNGSTTLNTTIVFNPSSGSGSWSSAGAMTTARSGHTATLLSTSIVTNGTVLVAGGNNGSGALSSAELWDGNTTWTATTALPYSVQGQTATSIGNGSVLIAGGVSGSTTLSSAALYDGSFGVGCTSNSQCVTGFCVSGVCCNTACTGSCGSCNLPGQVGTCSPVATGTVCRASAGTCDVPETCDGTSTACPADAVVASGTTCRSSAGACDVAETCTGSSAACPADAFQASGTVCRAANGTCDVAETCSGTTAACPADAFQSSGTVCRPSAGVCDVAETCTGSSGSCPTDGFQSPTTVCRTSAGACDVAENCDGSSANCPADEFQPLGTVCRPSAGACDVAEACTGQGADCPADGFASATTVCRPAAGPCDVAETCPGNGVTCPSDSLAANGTTCTDGNQCVTGKSCQLGVCTGGQSTPCAGSGSNTTASVGPTGGSVSVETSTVTFAPGAFTNATGVSVTSTTDAAPAGVAAYSPTYKFTPDGAQFSQAVTATFLVGLGLTHPTIMWSRPGGGWDDLGGTYINGSISTTVTHFSEGFVAESQCAGKSDGTSCSNGDLCSVDQCQGGLCTHVWDVTCSTPNTCHTAVCDPAIGCTSPPSPNGTVCDDGTPATQGYVCTAGTCGPIPIQNLPIDDIGGPNGISSAQAVNAAGQVVGRASASDGSLTAYRWTPPGSMIDLGVPSGAAPSAISNSGFVVGTVLVGQSYHVFSVGPDQQYTDLGPLGDDQPVFDPYLDTSVQGAFGWGVNDSGQITGSVATNGERRGFVYTPGQSWIDIGDLGARSTWASSIAADGTVVGASQLADTPDTTYAHFGHAVMYRNGLLIDLNDYLDPTTGATLVYAAGISDKYIVGTALSPGGAQVPFRFDRTTETVDMFPITWAGQTFTFAVNNVGEVIGGGFVDAAGTQQASFIYSDQLGFRNLNDLLPANSGWTLGGAAGINDSGDVVGWGYHNGVERAFRLRLSPEAIACAGQATNPAPVCLWVDGVAQTNAGMVAVFGYRNTGSTTIQPMVNEELLNGQLVANPVPAPPTPLLAGEHPGAFLPALGPQTTVSWTVDGQTVVASAEFARQLETIPIAGNGSAVGAEDGEVTVKSGVNTNAIVLRMDGIVASSLPGHYVALFGYDNNGPRNVHLPFGSVDNSVVIDGVPATNPSPLPPSWFNVGSHPGTFLIDFASTDTVTWTLAGQSVSASGQLQPLQPTTTAAGDGIYVDGQFVVVVPNPNAPFAGSITTTQQTNWGLPMAATFAVAADGAATAKVPIWVPPARAGLQPALALSYNSHSSTAFEGLGPGWSLEGLSQITRCPKNLARDGTLSDVTFNWGNGTDSWCLDGQRLIFQSGGTSQGGAWDNAVWRTEVDRFAKIVSHQTDGTDGRGPDSFDAYLKDGRVLHYGGGGATVEGPITTDALSAGSTGTLPTTTTTTQNARYAWALASTSDRSGNIINYSYETAVNDDRDPNLSSGAEPCVEQHIASITYGSQVIRFSYSGADAPGWQRVGRRMFVSGLCLENRRKMTQIDILGPRPDRAESQDYLKHYILTVQPEGLTTVIERDTTGAQKAVSFSYENASPIPAVPSFNARPVSISGNLPLSVPSFPGPYIASGDVNGDGCDDLVYLGNAAPTIFVQASNCGDSSKPPFGDPVAVAQGGSGTVALQVIDADRDGRADIVYSRQYEMQEGTDENGQNIFVDLGETTYMHSVNYGPGTTQFSVETSFDRTFGRPSPPIMADINGDGLVDLTALDDGAGPQWETFFLTKPLFSTATATLSTVSGGQVSSTLGPVVVAGRFASRLSTSFLSAIDLTPSALYVASYAGGNLVAPGLANAAVPYATRYVSLDLNGDGLSDLVSIDPHFGQVLNTDNTRTTPTAFINTGNGFRARDFGRLPTKVPTAALVSNTANLGAADIDKDGRDDLVILSQDPRHLVPANGPVPGWFYPSDGNSLSMPAPITDIVGAGDQPFLILDYNGDGRPDMMTLAPDGGGGYSLKVYENQQPRQLLVGMFGGLNDTPGTIVYDAVGRVARNTPGNSGCPAGVLYPTYCPPNGPLVVTQAYFNNRDTELGETGILETYSYDVPTMDAMGRGWLGVQNRRVVRTPITDPSQVLAVEDTEYGNAGSVEVIPHTADAQYYYPLAEKPISDITYYPNHGGALENTATAVSVGTRYQVLSLLDNTVYAWVPAVITAKKRTVSNFDQVLATIQPAFDANQWPTVGATDILSSQSTTNLFDGAGNPTNQSSVTNLSDGTQVTGTVLTQYQSDTDLWLVSQPTSRTVTETTPQGSATHHWVLTPDPRTGLLVHSTYQPGVPDEQLDTTYVRNGYGLPISITATIPTGESRTTTIEYDAFDGTFPSLVTDALGQVTKMVYHPGYGVLVGMEDANGQKASWAYDEFGRVTAEKGPDGNGAQIHYENPELQAGDARLGGSEVYQVHVLADSGEEAKTVFDTLNRQTVQWTKDYTGVAFDGVSTAYDSHNTWRASRVTMPALNPFDPATPASTYSYDNMGRVLTVTMPDGNGYSYTYGTDSSWSVTGPDGQSGSGTDDGRGLVIAKSDLVQKPTESSGHLVSQSFKYGPFGRLRSVTVGTGPTTTITYDASGRRTEVDDPDRGRTTYKWNGFGDQLLETDADGNVTVYTPDALGRIQQVITVDGVTTYEWDTAANGIGKISRTTSSDNVLSEYSYDSAGRPAGQAWTLNTGVAGVDGTYAVGVGYDPSGRTSSLTYPAVGGQPPVVLSQTYFPNGRLSGIVRSGQSASMWSVNSHNERGQISRETVGNGVVTTHDFLTTTGMLHEVTSTASGGQVLRDIVYQYDEAHRMRQRTTDGQVEIFQHDTIDRLVDWQTGATPGSPDVAYTYDDLGSLTLAQRDNQSPSTSVSFVPGDGVTLSPHQVASSSLGTYSYDARGDQFGAPGRAVTYMTFGLPKSVSSSAGITSFAYDGSRSRVLKVSPGEAIVSVGGLFERRVTNSQVTDVFYVPGEGKDVGQIVWSEGGGDVVEQVQYFHDDALGTVGGITDAAGQSMVRQDFEPFGARTSSAIPGIRLGYQGAEHDDELNLINMNGRIYDPAQFRFITADPVVGDAFFSQDMHRYAFVRNSPLNYTDPSGFDADPEDPPPNPSGCPGGLQNCNDNGDGTATPTGPHGVAVGPPGPGPYPDEPAPSPPDNSGPAAAPGWADSNGSSFASQMGSAPPVVDRWSSSLPYGGPYGGTVLPSSGAPGLFGGRPVLADSSGSQIMSELPPGCADSWCAPHESIGPMTRDANVSRSDGTMDLVSNVANAGNALATGWGYRLVAPNGKWRGNNGKYYSPTWGGNRYTGSRSSVKAAEQNTKLLAKWFFFMGTAVSLVQTYQAAHDHDGPGVRVGMEDIGAGFIGFYGGPVGAVFSFGWWLGRTYP